MLDTSDSVQEILHLVHSRLVFQKGMAIKYRKPCLQPSLQARNLTLFSVVQVGFISRVFLPTVGFIALYIHSPKSTVSQPGERLAAKKLLISLAV